jgi:hypothetical protein
MEEDFREKQIERSKEPVRLVLTMEVYNVFSDGDRIRIYMIDDHTDSEIGAGYLASYTASPAEWHIYGEGENLFGLRPRPNANVNIVQALEAAAEDWGTETEEDRQANPFLILLEELDERRSKYSSKLKLENEVKA